MLGTIYLLKNGSIQENYRKLYVLDRSHVGNLFSIGEGVVIILYVVRWTIWTNILLNVDFIQFVVNYWFFKSSVFLELKSMVFHLLRFAFFFEFLFLPPLCTSSTPLTHFPRPCACVCVLSMPRQRESLHSAKTRLSLELKNRTERRVRDILCPK